MGESLPNESLLNALIANLVDSLKISARFSSALVNPDVDGIRIISPVIEDTDFIVRSFTTLVEGFVPPTTLSPLPAFTSIREPKIIAGPGLKKPAAATSK